MVHLREATPFKKVGPTPPEAINYQQLLCWCGNHAKMATEVTSCRSCTGGHSCPEVMSTAVLSFLEDHSCLWSVLTSGTVPEPSWEEGHDTDVLPWLSVAQTLSSVFWPVSLTLFFHIYLFQKSHCSLFPEELELTWR